MRILLTVSALNDLNLRFFDVGIAYLDLYIWKLYLIVGISFVPDIDSTKSRNEGAICGKVGWCITCKNLSVKASGFKYYEYISTQVDDGMTISDKYDNIIKVLE